MELGSKFAKPAGGAGARRNLKIVPAGSLHQSLKLNRTMDNPFGSPVLSQPKFGGAGRPMFGHQNESEERTQTLDKYLNNSVAQRSGDHSRVMSSGGNRLSGQG